MWNNAAHLLMVRVKFPNHRGVTIPIPLYVVCECIKALADLAWIGKATLKFMVVPRNATLGRQINGLKRLLLSQGMTIIYDLVKDLSDYKGLEVVRVETEDIQVKVYLR